MKTIRKSRKYHAAKYRSGSAPQQYNCNDESLGATDIEHAERKGFLEQSTKQKEKNSSKLLLKGEPNRSIPIL